MSDIVGGTGVPHRHPSTGVPPRKSSSPVQTPDFKLKQVFADYIWLEIIREILPILQLHTDESTTAATIRATTGVDMQSLVEQ